MITWHAITSKEFNEAPISLKTEDKIFFLIDTNEIYRGNQLYTKFVEFYENEIPENPVVNRMYIEKNTLEIRIWDGSNWLILIYPVQMNIDVLNTTKPVTGFAVYDFLNKNFIKYTESQELNSDQKLQARSNIDAVSNDEVDSKIQLLLDTINTELSKI